MGTALKVILCQNARREFVEYCNIALHEQIESNHNQTINV